MLLRIFTILKKNISPPKTLKAILGIAWAQADGFIKSRLVLTLVLVFCGSILAAISPIALKLLIDGLTGGDIHNAVYSPAFLILIYLFSLWIYRSLSEFRKKIFSAADQRLNRNLSRQLFKHVMQLPMMFHLNRETGALSQTLINGLAGYSIILQHIIFSFLPTIVEILMIGIILSSLYPAKFLIILCISIICYIGAFAVGVARITTPSRQVAKAQTEAYASLTDSILNTETIKYFNGESHVHDRFDKILSVTERKWACFYSHQMINGLWVTIIFTLSLGTSMVLATRQVMQGQMTVGDFILIHTYMLQIISPLETLGFAFRDMAQGISFTEKMIDLLTQKKEPFQNTSPLEPISGKGKLRFDRVSFSYVKGISVLKDISFTIEPGKILAIVGVSGSGKSTVSRLLFRLFDPDEGNILINEKSISEIPLAQLRSYIAVVPQDSILFNDTIAYNIGFGEPNCDLQEIEQAARLAHIHQRIAAMPNGYQTMVGERGIKLSGGEKQRISIARAILKKPQIIIFDEATSSLDTKTEQHILNKLITQLKGTTTLVIAHRLSTVIHADEILVLDQGSIIERGTHADLIKKNKTYASLWHTQQRSSSLLRKQEE